MRNEDNYNSRQGHNSIRKADGSRELIKMEKNKNHNIMLKNIVFLAPPKGSKQTLDELNRHISFEGVKQFDVFYLKNPDTELTDIFKLCETKLTIF